MSSGEAAIEDVDSPAGEVSGEEEGSSVVFGDGDVSVDGMGGGVIGDSDAFRCVGVQAAMVPSRVPKKDSGRCWGC
jgi:hypothetical protein